MPQNRATFVAMWRGLALVLLPGAAFAFGLIYLIAPKPVPPPQNWADGTYINPCCAPLTLHNGVISIAGDTTRFIVSSGKYGNQLELDRGMGVLEDQVVFGGASVFVFFNDASPTDPAHGEAKMFHLYGRRDGRDYVFTKR